MAYAIGKDHEVLGDVEQLPGSEEFARELRVKELVAVVAGAVEHEHGVVDATVRATVRRTECRVVKAQLRQHLAGVKPESLRDKISFLCRNCRLCASAATTGEHRNAGDECPRREPPPELA